MKPLFSIRPKAGGYLISDNNIDNATFIPNQEALHQLYDSIGKILEIENPPTPPSPNTETPEMITTGDAIAYAKEQGYDLGFTTINSACDRGSIPGATRNDGERYARWSIPRNQFLLWFTTWKNKIDRKNA